MVPATILLVAVFIIFYIQCFALLALTSPSKAATTRQVSHSCVDDMPYGLSCCCRFMCKQQNINHHINHLHGIHLYWLLLMSPSDANPQSCTPLDQQWKDLIFIDSWHILSKLNSTLINYHLKLKPTVQLLNVRSVTVVHR